MNKYDIRFGLAGCGDFSSHLAGYILPVADITAVCDPDAAARTAFVKATGLQVQEYSDCGQMCAQAPIDVVAIAAPNFAHKPLTIAAAREGKHVFCEKAMAPSVPDCWEMVRVCHSHNVRLMVGHKRRLRPPWSRMMELREELGRVLSISSCLYFDGAPYYRGWWTRERQCGGTLFAAGVHIVDWMRAMCGDAKSVRAIAAPKLDTRYDYPDTLHVWIDFHSSAIAALDVSLSFTPIHFRESGGPRVVFDRGHIRFDLSVDGIDLFWQRVGESESHHEHYSDLGYRYAFAKEITDFIRWVKDGTTPCLTWIEGLRCVEIMEAAQRSAKENGSILQLPLYPDLEPESE